ncbi:unnamed protein product [Periconia digitata]|uniref:NAD(P)-binding domain-containing protein n=1 Tax=Periconia digitata TaxID=1303443 RepID=A0A9W4U602_9PLEO|nr:unnamed protein product [Periconia digitata]
MSTNILVTGAGGYIGGSIVADFLTSTLPSLKNIQITAAVRSDEQVAALQTLKNVKVIQLKLDDEEAVANAILEHEIDIVIQTVSSVNATLSLPLVSALGKRKAQTGKPTYYVHTSGLSAFYIATGWPEGNTSDRDPLFETAKELRDSFPIRNTDVSITEKAKEVGVTSFIVVPSQVVGRGTGPYNQLSVLTPRYVLGAIQQKKMHRFPNDTVIPTIHVKDLTSLYAILVDKILTNQSIDANERGFYFGISFNLSTATFHAHLAPALKARDLIQDTNIDIWSLKEASKILDVPEGAVGFMFNSSGIINHHTQERLPGWQPAVTEDVYLKNVDDEITDVVELGEAKSSLLASLKTM